MSGFFVTGGTMKPGAPSYIPRIADEELYNAILKGEYCTILTTRQMGKSSLMARTAARLREQGVACATVDLQGKGEQNPPKDQWYYGIAKQIADGLNLPSDWTAWWKQQEMLLPAQRLTDLFADIVLKQITGRVVVFIDEVDWMIRLPFSDEFFAAIRSCYNRRAMDSAFDRLTFVLLGSAAPAQLIKDATRTPFNIGRGIELTDFTPEEAKSLATPLGANGDPILARIFHWTDGHPYLTQMLCASVTERGASTLDPVSLPSRDREGADSAIALVDSVVQGKLLSTAARQEENNLKFVADRLTQATRDLRRVLRVYRDVVRGKPVKDVPASPIHTSLRLSGAVKPDTERQLRVRNRVYRQVFDEAWVSEEMPSDVAWITRGAALLALLAILSLWYLLLFPKAYKQALETASNDVQVAYNAYDALHKPFHTAQADDLLAQFFERRGDRDEAILVRARAADGGKLAGLIGADYPLLERTSHHEGDVTSVAFSPDGKLVATGSADNTARVFEAATGWEVSRLAHQGLVAAVAFSPNGKLVATGSADKTARVFQAATGREVSRLDHLARVDAVAFSPDGKLVATGSADTTARVFQAVTGRELSRLAHQGLVAAVAFSPYGKLVATGSADKTARVFQAATGRELSRLAHQNGVDAVAFSPDGKLVATGSADKTARVFQAAT
ncbi:MAG TPA: AAA-like domain-containing protein, partial [Bryobacteraceae bacterium]|nr:AAA-like domain-containing protein [Bryobacteraceae bacterium]